ncbi:hypothetical protein LTR84_008592 [Exophiala bonariae]|uniref:C3H1-type domain-containing protein n=1 Tax=Exophiala bonariae TaxID=1690606 RepID=A0AAV9MYW5_9EURO|nr:hypothetical protein LTR84_008592 [Exophiala bonariae]
MAMAQGHQELDLASPKLMALAQQYDSRKATIHAALSSNDELIQDLLQLLADQEKELKNLQLDKAFEAEGRRNWQERATLLESKIKGSQHVLLLVDGNYHFFKQSFFRAGTAGVKEAVEPLLDQIRDFAKEQHKHDLPENTIPVVHIFSDIDRLAADLQIAGADPRAFLDFCQELCQLPYFTMSDCGSSDPRTTGIKVEKLYELYLENCHCRHVFLALGPDSEYYKTLQMYNDDPYTKGKTSLVLPNSGGSIPNNLSYHTVQFSSLFIIPRGSFPQFIPSHPPRTIEQGREINSQTSLLPIVDTSKVPDAGQPVVKLPSIAVGEPPVTATSHQPVMESAKPQAGGLSVNLSRNEVTQFENDQVFKLAPTHSSSSGSNKTDKPAPWDKSDEDHTSTSLLGSWGDEPVGASSGASPSYQQHSTRNGSTNGNWNPKNNVNKTGNGNTTGGWGNRGNTNNIANGNTTGDWSSRGNGKGRSRRMPTEFEGSFDDWVNNTPQTRPSITSPGRLTSDQFRNKKVEIDDPNPFARPIWAPFGVNKQGQRLDLNLPKITPSQSKNYSARVNHQRLCNNHHLLQKCDHANCPYDHDPIDADMWLSLRVNARKSPCHLGSSCRKHDCVSGHHCVNMSNTTKCLRHSCPFKDLHETRDLEVTEVITPPMNQL